MASLIAAFLTLFSLNIQTLCAESLSTKPFNFEAPNPELIASCDPGVVLTARERETVLNKLKSSQTGLDLLSDFTSNYGSFQNLMIQWDSVSYSQVVSPDLSSSHRAIASQNALGTAVCVHLTKKLPHIEHVADLAHELAHATRLERRVLRGEVSDVDEFVKARLTSRGGEADAFSVECTVKREILGSWDSLCAPYARSSGANSQAPAASSIDTERVIHDFYNGHLSASLTGETYPVMLSRQYQAMLARKALSQVAKNPKRRPASLPADPN